MILLGLVRLIVFWGALATAQVGGAQTGPGAISVRSFLPEAPLSRAGRIAKVVAGVFNGTEQPASVSLRLTAPPQVRIIGSAVCTTPAIPDHGIRSVTWDVEASVPGTFRLEVQVVHPTSQGFSTPLDMLFLAKAPARGPSRILEPVPAKTQLLVGALNCPLWEADKPAMWDNIVKHPERTPALGSYAQENPEVSDWETKWALEHGVSFFVYCWYRNGQASPVKMNYGSAIHDALFKSRFRDRMKFAIMWENQARNVAGVADQKDLIANLLPFWIDTYFKRSNYLNIDNKPVLFIYRPEFLIDDLKGEGNVRTAFDLMRKACRRAGFDGLYLLGEYRGADPEHLRQMKRLGLDYTFAYYWPAEGNPSPPQAVDAQMRAIRQTQDLAILPQVVTVSQGWSGWADEGSIWKIPPGPFEGLLRQAKDFVATLPQTELGSKMLLLDNWNEWGEGHYIAPNREFGFGYLDAVRNVFSSSPRQHADILPEDIGLGPYDTAYRAYSAQVAKAMELASRRVVKRGAPAAGLVGWWTFDEPSDSPVAQDWSGGRLGGRLLDARRIQGVDGRGLECQGGCVLVDNDPRLNPSGAMSLECLVKTSSIGQANNWFINKVRAGGTDTGYRMGLIDDKPCFNIRLTSWSHHLVSPDPIPLNRWVHLAGTCDGATMRLYVDGKLTATMPRTGPIKPNAFPLCLGNYEECHPAFFRGALDEVRLYSRALSAQEIRTHSREFVSN